MTVRPPKSHRVLPFDFYSLYFHYILIVCILFDVLTSFLLSSGGRIRCRGAKDWNATGLGLLREHREPGKRTWGAPGGIPTGAGDWSGHRNKAQCSSGTTGGAEDGESWEPNRVKPPECSFETPSSSLMESMSCSCAGLNSWGKNFNMHSPYRSQWVFLEDGIGILKVPSFIPLRHYCSKIWKLKQSCRILKNRLHEVIFHGLNLQLCYYILK